MNPLTKLALGFLATFIVGVSLMCAGFGKHYQLAAIFGGMLIAVFGLVAFAAIWRQR